MTKGDLTREQRLQIMLAPDELAAVDDYRFKQRMPSRAAAVRDLLRLGLASVGIEPAEIGVKSGEFGVLERRNGNGDTSNGAAKPKRPKVTPKEMPKGK